MKIYPFCHHVGQALGDQEVAVQNIEAQAARLGKVEVAVVGGVAEIAGGDDKFRIIPLWMTFGQQVIPGQGKPGFEGLSAIRAAVDAFEMIALVDIKGVAAQGVGVRGHSRNKISLSWSNFPRTFPLRKKWIRFITKNGMKSLDH